MANHILNLDIIEIQESESRVSNFRLNRFWSKFLDSLSVAVFD